MSIEAIGFLPAAQPIVGAEAAVAPQAPSPAAFGEWFSGQVQQVNTGLVASQKDVQGLALGDAQNLHHVMIKLEESKLAFQLMVQVRTRLLEAYQEIMRMQV